LKLFDSGHIEIENTAVKDQKLKTKCLKDSK